jgi:hypothetical protein
MADQTRVQGLYGLYKDEKKHEAKTQRMLQDLEKNSQQMQAAKVRLIEKLLDIQLKDEVSRQMNLESNDIAPEQRISESLRESAKRRLEAEVKANIGEARKLYHDGFMAHLDQMVHTPEDQARSEVRTMVDQYVDPHIELQRRQQRRKPQSTLESIAAAASQVRVQRKKELDEQHRYQAMKDVADRIARVDSSMKTFKRDIGDLTPLLYCQPIEYKTQIGVKEAELNDLRQTILRQKADEERLLQERQIQLAIIDSDMARLVADVDASCQKLILLQRELETKELDLKEMAASQAPGNGTWATNTMQLERDLSLAVEEEFHLRHEADEVRKTLDILQAERSAMDLEVTQSVLELNTAQTEHQSVLSRIEQKLSKEKATLYALRENELETTRKINELRYRILFRREDVRRQKRDLRAVINTTISQLSIEDRLQSALMARSLEMQKAAEKARAQSDHHITSLNNQLMTINSDLKSKSAQISSLAEQVTNFWAGAERMKDVKKTATQLQTEIDQLVKEWARVEWEAASQVAQLASRVDLNTREKDAVLKQMAGFAVLQEELAPEGIEVEHTPTEELERVRDFMYNDATQRAYREAKYAQSIRMFRDRSIMKARGERVEPLTRNRRVSLEERRLRREATERSKQARHIALEHLRRHNENSDRGRTNRSVSRASGSVAGSDQPSSISESNEFRSMVISFIKKEIQPLYDTNQITKKRFIDIVSRVSSWYLETHPPTSELSETNVKELVRKIQEVISWQDEERMRRGGN